MKNQELSDLYKIRFAQSELARKNAIWQEICRFFQRRYIREDATVLDVACGYGEFINNIKAARKYAVDLNPDTPACLNDDVQFFQAGATELSSHVPADCDLVFTSNFLEHLPNKSTLDTFLQEVYSVLKPNGVYMVLGPNLRYLPGEYWDFYDHHLGLTHLSLVEALKLRGFVVDVCIDRFLPYSTQGKLPTHPLLVRLFLLFPFMWRLLGKQFLVIARRPA